MSAPTIAESMTRLNGGCAAQSKGFASSCRETFSTDEFRPHQVRSLAAIGLVANTMMENQLDPEGRNGSRNVKMNFWL